MFKSGGNYKRSSRKFLIIGSNRHCFVRIFADINDGTDFNIPDNNTTGITSTITVSGRSGNAPSNTQVAVNIVHTYSGDLIVELLAPDNTVYTLQNRTGGSADNIVKTFTTNLSSETINGAWKLRVKDRASSDTGYINSWSITM